MDNLIKDLLKEGVKKGIFPGGAVVVSCQKGLEWIQSKGMAGM